MERYIFDSSVKNVKRKADSLLSENTVGEFFKGEKKSLLNDNAKKATLGGYVTTFFILLKMGFFHNFFF